MVDTDSFSGIIRHDARILANVEKYREQIFLSAIALREAVRGSLTTVARAESGKGSLPTSLKLLAEIVTTSAQFAILPFDKEAEQLVQGWPKHVIRVGPNDCRIAASALVHNATIVTSNMRDFEKIAESLGDLSLVNWRS